ncbi:hypothetical protein SBV1_1080013 [Verrucomicrobia bacterium]|nr:hypothetical protein SBV1_1080013 [Verrucomicrobiota bacterium]
MSFLPAALLFSLPLFLELLLGAIVLKYALQFVFKLVHFPNYTSSCPSSFLSWTKLAPADVLFRLGFLAALNLESGVILASRLLWFNVLATGLGIISFFVF